jgi:hypothetical protein
VTLLTLGLLSLLPLGLGGCHILDQRDLPQALGGAPPVPPAPAPLPPPPAGPPPLVTIRPAAGVDYLPPLREAVAAARARKPDVQFDVVAAVPAAGAPDAQIAAAHAGTAAAAEVARAIVGLGVPASQVRLSARTDTALTQAAIRIYVQ